MTQRAPKREAVRACAEWLTTCLRLGWSRDSLDFLEGLWWKYHDDHGRLITSTALSPSRDEATR